MDQVRSFEPIRIDSPDDNVALHDADKQNEKVPLGLDDKRQQTRNSFSKDYRVRAGNSGYWAAG
jgi:hypothetical protein